MATPIVVFPDARTAVIDRIKAEAPSFGYTGLTVASMVPNPRPTGRFVTVDRTGGPRRDLVVEEAQLTIDAWGTSDIDAYDLAQVVRGIVGSLAGRSYGGVTFYRVDELAGPQHLPDPDSAHQPRYRWSVLAQVRGRRNVGT